MRPVLLFELPSLTPREVAIKSCAPNERERQELTLYIEISRAEKRYERMVNIVRGQRLYATFSKRGTP